MMAMMMGGGGVADGGAGMMALAASALDPVTVTVLGVPLFAVLPSLLHFNFYFFRPNYCLTRSHADYNEAGQWGGRRHNLFGGNVDKFVAVQGSAVVTLNVMYGIRFLMLPFYSPWRQLKGFQDKLPVWPTLAFPAVEKDLTTYTWMAKLWTSGYIHYDKDIVRDAARELGRPELTQLNLPAADWLLTTDSERQLRVMQKYYTEARRAERLDNKNRMERYEKEIRALDANNLWLLHPRALYPFSWPRQWLAYRSYMLMFALTFGGVAGWYMTVENDLLTTFVHQFKGMGPVLDPEGIARLYADQAKLELLFRADLLNEYLNHWYRSDGVSERAVSWDTLQLVRRFELDHHPDYLTNPEALFERPAGARETQRLEMLEEVAEHVRNHPLEGIGSSSPKDLGNLEGGRRFTISDLIVNETREAHLLSDALYQVDKSAATASVRAGELLWDVKLTTTVAYPQDSDIAMWPFGFPYVLQLLAPLLITYAAYRPVLLRWRDQPLNEPRVQVDPDGHCVSVTQDPCLIPPEMTKQFGLTHEGVVPVDVSFDQNVDPRYTHLTPLPGKVQLWEHDPAVTKRSAYLAKHVERFLRADPVVFLEYLASLPSSSAAAANASPRQGTRCAKEEAEAFTRLDVDAILRAVQDADPSVRFFKPYDADRVEELRATGAFRAEEEEEEMGSVPAGHMPEEYLRLQRAFKGIKAEYRQGNRSAAWLQQQANQALLQDATPSGVWQLVQSDWAKLQKVVRQALGKDTNYNNENGDKTTTAAQYFAKAVGPWSKVLPNLVRFAVCQPLLILAIRREKARKLWRYRLFRGPESIMKRKWTAYGEIFPYYFYYWAITMFVHLHLVYRSVHFAHRWFLDRRYVDEPFYPQYERRMQEYFDQLLQQRPWLAYYCYREVGLLDMRGRSSKYLRHRFPEIRQVVQVPDHCTLVLNHSAVMDGRHRQRAEGTLAEDVPSMRAPLPSLHIRHVVDFGLPQDKEQRAAMLSEELRIHSDPLSDRLVDGKQVPVPGLQHADTLLHSITVVGPRDEDVLELFRRSPRVSPVNREGHDPAEIYQPPESQAAMLLPDTLYKEEKTTAQALRRSAYLLLAKRDPNAPHPITGYEEYEYQPLHSRNPT